MRPDTLGPETSATGSGDAAFKFLDFFTEEDRELFEGRDDAVEAVLAGALRSRTFVLYGASGSGKTSLLLAGVFPELRDRGYRPLYVRVLEDPEADLTRALREAWTSDEPPPDDLQTLLVRLSAQAPLVVVLDQFEEFFVRFEGDNQRRAAFIALLGRLLGDRQIDLRVIFSLRQEWLGELDDFREVLPGLLDFEYRLRSLTAFGARQAIARQLAAAGVDYEPRLLLDLVDRLEQYHFDPTILQILCFEMYRRARMDEAGTVRLTAEHLRAVGEIGTMFEEFLDQFAAELDEETGLVARAVLDALTTRKRTKRALRAGEVSSTAIVASEEESRAVLESLARGRLVRKQERGGEAWFELIHERLVPVVTGWLDRDPLYFEFRLARELATNPVRTDTRADAVDALVGSAQLDGVIARFEDRLLLSPAQVKFLFRSCLFARSETALRTWASRMTEDTRRGVLHDALNSSDAGVRAGGAWATRFVDPDPFRGTLVTLAVQDESEDVRRAAAETLGAVGGKPEMAALVGAFRTPDPAEAGAAFEALCQLYQAGQRIQGVGLLTRRRIARTVKRRVLARSGPEIAEARRHGAKEGGIAGALWGLLVGTPIVTIAGWSTGRLSFLPDLVTWRGNPHRPSMIVGTVLLLTLFSWAAGRLVGWALSHAAATRRVVQRRVGWFRITLAGGNWWLLLGLTALCALGFASLLLDGEDMVFAAAPAIGLMVLGVIFGGAVKALLGGMVALAHRAATRPDPFPAPESLPFAAAVGLPVLVPGLLAYLFPGYFTAYWPLAAGVLSFLVLVLVRAAATFGESAPAEPEPRAGPAAVAAIRWTWPRALIYGSFGIVLVGTPFAVGRDTVPFAFLHPVQAGGAALEGTLKRLRPDAAFFRVDVGQGSLAVIEASVEPFSHTWLRLDGRRLAMEGPLTLPAGVHWLAVETDDAAFSNGPVDFVAGLNPRPVLRSGDTLSGAADGLRFIETRLSRATGSPDSTGCRAAPAWHSHRYSGRVGGVIPGGGRGLVVELRVLPLNYNAAAGDVRFASLCVLDGRPAVQVGDSAGTVPLRFAAAPQTVDTTGTPLRVAVDSMGAWGAEVRLMVDTHLGRAGLQFDDVPLLLAMKVDTVRRVDPYRLLNEALAWGDSARTSRGPEARDPRAEARFVELTALALRENSEFLPNDVCWWGALDGFAAVVMPACEHAVSLAPGLPWVRDSRGIARGLLGNAQGAMEDLEAFIAAGGTSGNAEALNVRRELVEGLKAGVDPAELFGAELRARLRRTS
ncbi:MAG: hypothetical protein AMXMBFR53_01890 [Gemmatimonadota bacterium]